MAHSIEELRIDQQFAFLPNSLLHALREFLAAQPVFRLKEFH